MHSFPVIRRFISTRSLEPGLTLMVWLTVRRSPAVNTFIDPCRAHSHTQTHMHTKSAPVKQCMISGKKQMCVCVFWGQYTVTRAECTQGRGHGGGGVCVLAVYVHWPTAASCKVLIFSASLVFAGRFLDTPERWRRFQMNWRASFHDFTPWPTWWAQREELEVLCVGNLTWQNSTGSFSVSCHTFIFRTEQMRLWRTTSCVLNADYVRIRRPGSARRLPCVAGVSKQTSETSLWFVFQF